MNVINYFNPRHAGFEEARTNFHQLKGWQKTIAVVASIAAGILPPLFFLGSIAMFRWTVELLVKGDLADKAKSAAQGVLRPDSKEAAIPPNDTTDLISEESDKLVSESRLSTLKRELKAIIEDRYAELEDYCQAHSVNDYATENMVEYLANCTNDMVELDDFIEKCLFDNISGDLYDDPVIASDGHTYSRNTLNEWYRTCLKGYRIPTTPLAKKEFDPNDVFSHPIINAIIKKWKLD